MIPYMSVFQRIVAWLLWRFEGFGNTETAEFEILEHPELLHCVSILRDYWYIRKAREEDE